MEREGIAIKKSSEMFSGFEERKARKESRQETTDNIVALLTTLVTDYFPVEEMSEEKFFTFQTKMTRIVARRAM